MAYTRNESEKLEIDYPIEKIWPALAKAVELLQWKIEEKDDEAHKYKIKTKGGFMSYGSILSVEVKATDEKTTHMTINGETPVTTITSMADFGRTRDRIDLLIDTIAKIIEAKPAPKKENKKI